MKQQFDASSLSRIIDQALVYQCACPAQVCRSILELRELYDYQRNCGNEPVNDRKVHDTIADATSLAHEAMEQCLERILVIEGWDKATLTMPESLRKKVAKSL
jgi:hypothetical protein